mmetsp:Transcript_34801/g.98662  ORF Transcript_34801/g.98662 Transcript_34801/m.98662 type:complete len:382 (-) Transcript_34801:146-1291(-)
MSSLGVALCRGSSSGKLQLKRPGHRRQSSSSSPDLRLSQKCSGRRNLSVSAVQTGGLQKLQKLGRVLKEKAEADLDRVLKGTSKTREKLGVVEELFTYWNLDDYEDILEELEDALISSDFGPKTALKVVDTVRERVMAGELKSGDDIRAALKDSIRHIMVTRGGNTELQLGDSKPAVVLILGVNGGGKTTSVGKLAYKFNSEGLSVSLAPGDTFRAAAAEQLEEWARRSNAKMGTFEEGMKPEDVLFNTVDDATASEDIDVVLCDTSGRLHNNFKLMEELKRCKESIQKACGGAPHEVLLVLDGTTGLNMLNQAREFSDLVGVTGIILTKLDGSARGGAVVSVVDELGVPVKFVGVGETADDLQPFNPETFVDALFPDSSI